MGKLSRGEVVDNGCEVMYGKEQGDGTNPNEGQYKEVDVWMCWVHSLVVKGVYASTLSNCRSIPVCLYLVAATRLK